MLILGIAVLFLELVYLPLSFLPAFLLGMQISLKVIETGDDRRVSAAKLITSTRYRSVPRSREFVEILCHLKKGLIL